MDLELLDIQGSNVPRRWLGWMLLSYLLALAMNKMTQTVVVKLSSIHLDRRLRMFIVLILILNVDVDAVGTLSFR